MHEAFIRVDGRDGETLPMIGKLLGHAQSATTERYAHLADDPVRAANEKIGEAIAASIDGKKRNVRKSAGSKRGAVGKASR